MKRLHLKCAALIELNQPKRVMECNMNTGLSGSIRLPLRVTFADGSDFRKQLIGALESNLRHLTIDLSETEFMDSAGLGMLLVALKECQSHSISLVLHKPKGDVKKLLELTRSDERFQIAY
jgi:HptB-dependent secretion and biofilm anti anti-sigma factor